MHRDTHRDQSVCRKNKIPRIHTWRSHDKETLEVIYTCVDILALACSRMCVSYIYQKLH